MAKKYFFPERDINKIVTEYNVNLKPIYTISDMFGVDSSVIKRVLSENGIKTCGGSPYGVKHWLCRGLTEEESQHKLKTLKPIYTEFWLNKGYSEVESKLKAKHHTNNSLEACIYNLGEEDGRKKWGEIMSKNRETNKKKSKRCVDYWLGCGFTYDESVNKVKEHQTTFSKEKCIKTYGDEDGLKIYNERQNKWITSLNKTKKDLGGFNHDGSSVEYYKSKYGDVWYQKRCDDILRKSKYGDIIKQVLDSCEDLPQFLSYVEENKDVFFNTKVIRSVSNSCLILDRMVGLTPQKITSYINNILYGKTVKSTFGVIIREDGEIFKSKSEYSLSKKFKEYGFVYEYEKNYPKSKKKCDFYIPKHNLYIEYTGMYKLSKKRDDYVKILKRYKENMDKKTNICLEFGLNCLFSSDISDIIKYVEYEEENYDKRSV